MENNTWIVRVQGKEYGPVSTEALREWKLEGRLIRENEIRSVEENRWIAAGELSEVFSDEPPPIPQLAAQPKSWRQIFRETIRIYRAGFWRLILFGLLSAVPIFFLQSTFPNVALPDLTSVQSLSAVQPISLPPLSIGIFIVLLALWPVSVAGMQIVADDIFRERTRSFGDQFLLAL
ncbi:MAG TPA: hypothetical protein VGI42_00605, partial [Chthoniobacterales bacterium]